MSVNSTKQNITQTLSWLATNKKVTSVTQGANGIVYAINSKPKRRKR